MFDFVGRVNDVVAWREDDSVPLPQYAHFASDAGMDIWTTESGRIEPGCRRSFGTGLHLNIPKGIVGLVHPRSGLAFKKGITVVNSPGTIDAGYTGEIKVCLLNTGQYAHMVHKGDRIAQIVFQKFEIVNLREVNENTFSKIETERGNGGYGSTGA